MRLWTGAALALLLAAPQAPQITTAVPQAPLEEEVRAVIQQYYGAQAARDPDKAVAFWSAAANPRMTRDTFVALFGGPAEDQYTVEIQSLTVNGAEARARVQAFRTRVETRDGRAFTSRSGFNNSQTWRKEAAGWKLLRDAPFADELADQYLAGTESDRAALVEQQTPLDRGALRYAISQRASMAAIARDFVRAKMLFGLALDLSRITADRRAEANSFHNIGQANYFLRDYAGATDAYEKELVVARETDDQNAASAALYGLASVDYARADYTPALARYREALEIYEKNEDGSSIGRTLVSIGNIQYLQAEYDAASASYRRGLAVLSQDPPGAAFARRGLARVLGAQGDIPAALEIYGAVLADARAALQADPRLKSDVATALEAIGELYYRLGNTDQARASFEEAKRLDEADPESLGRVLAALGKTELVAGRFDAALAAYTDSRTRFETARNAEGVAHAWVGAGFSQAARRKFTQAAAAYRTAIGLFEKLSNNDGAARAWLGLSYAQSGDGDQGGALESAGKVSAIADGLKSDDLAWRGATRTGEVLRKLRRFDEARLAFDRATTAIDRLAADAPVNTEARGELADSASAWAGLAFTFAEQGDAAAALRTMEARRAHIRRVDFAAFQHDIARGATGDELADEQAIVREIIATRAQLRAEALSARHDPGRAERLGQQLAGLTAKRADQQSRLYARLPELPLWRGLPQPPMEPAAIGDLVPGPQGLLVDYLLTDDELLVVSVKRGENGPDVAASITSINRQAIADALAAALQPAILQDADQWRTKAAPLATALLGPIAARIEDRDRVVVVPDDLLWKIPFEALPYGDGNLASRAALTYATSLATLALQRRAGTAVPPEPPAAGVLAAPTIPDGIRAQLLLTQSTWRAQDVELARAAAQAVASAYGESVPVHADDEASEAAARTLLAESDVLHVQAPLQVSGGTPLLSSIILAASGDTPDADGRFEARDWFDLTARVRVMVLADGSAFGAAGVGNAMDSMAWAAAAAGVSTLVVGRWPLDAFAADALAAAFHGKLAAGAAAAAAWRAAADEARQKSPAPSAWAGLRLIGGS